MFRTIDKNLKKRKGWDLLSLLIWSACVVVLIAVLTPKFTEYQNNNRRVATAKEMKVLAEQCAIYAARSLDGKPPTTLGSLVTGLSASESNDGIAYGNFLTSTKVTSNASSFIDKWKNAYVYDATARTITSTAGGGTSIVEAF